MDVDGCGWTWMDVDGRGWTWMDGDGRGWVWMGGYMGGGMDGGTGGMRCVRETLGSKLPFTSSTVCKAP